MTIESALTQRTIHATQILLRATRNPATPEPLKLLVQQELDQRADLLADLAQELAAQLRQRLAASTPPLARAA